MLVNILKTRRIVLERLYMAVTRRNGGISGKECPACKEWKPFADFNMEKKRGGNIRIPSIYCTLCTKLAKAEEKKNNKTKYVK